MEIVKTKVQLYEKYKDSGVTWLGDIPEHWEVESFKNILTERNEKNEPIRSKEILSLSIDKGVTLYAEKTTNLDRFKDDFTQYKLAYKGDLVLNSMNMIVGAVGVSDYFGCVSPVYYTYHGGLDNSYTSKFYEYLFRCKTVQGVLYSLGKGLIAIDRGEGKYNTLRLKVSRDDLRSLRLPFPNLFEQTAIVTYLNRKTALIDQAIGIKQKQIELLKERRQILIHKAVTRGLNPFVKLKDSGKEWIGEIPDHWEVKKLRYLANCFPSNIDKHSKTNEKKIRLCNYTDVYKNDYISDAMDLMIATASVEQINKFTLYEGDIVITKDSETASDIAVPAYIIENLTNVVCGYHLAIIRTYQRSYSKYLFQALKTKMFNAQFEVCSNGITRVGLGNSDLKNGSFLLPPKQEQIEISEFIEKCNSKITSAISFKEREVEKLREYKATLINSAVTGKIKVS
jgi:type I restriction enzyme S subunit